ncbi:hydroxymethylbilane synthase [bacterium]|nr:hydroxymethylbilane synthase [bacterium]
MTLFPKSVRIGTRGSELARAQAAAMARRIEALGVAAEIVVVRTRGDIDQHTPVSRIGSKAIFIKELEDALIEHRIDLAVHSLKDLPVELPEYLVLAAVPERVSPLDAWVCPSGKSLDDTPHGATVATGSLRRAAQLLALRPDLKIVPMRGNVPTRIEKLRAGEAFATVLAAAGLHRLGLESEIAYELPADIITPAMGQGALAIEARSGEMPGFFRALDDANARVAVEAERRFLSIIGGGCRTPVGILARQTPTGWELIAMLAANDGANIMRRTVRLPGAAYAGSGAEKLAREMLDEAPPEILDTLEETGNP